MKIKRWMEVSGERLQRVRSGHPEVRLAGVDLLARPALVPQITDSRVGRMGRFSHPPHRLSLTTIISSHTECITCITRALQPCKLQTQLSSFRLQVILGHRTIPKSFPPTRSRLLLPLHAHWP
jgi:hypothetical protein